MAGAFDSLIPNRRQVLWDAGLGMRHGRNGQRAFPGAVNGDVPGLPDFTTHERMAGEYRVMGIYPRGHLMEFVRPGLGSQAMPAAAIEHAAEGEEVLVAGWPIARQHPRGEDGTVFVTIEDETGDAQLILWPQVFRQNRRQPSSHVLLARGVISRWDSTTYVVASEVRGVHPRVPMPAAHDWR